MSELNWSSNSCRPNWDEPWSLPAPSTRPFKLIAGLKAFEMPLSEGL